MILNLALIGAGRIAKVHVGAIAASPSARLTAVADVPPASASNLASQWDCEAKTVAEITADPAIDAVLVCAPTDTHGDLTGPPAGSPPPRFVKRDIDPWRCVRADRPRCPAADRP